MRIQKTGVAAASIVTLCLLGNEVADSAPGAVAEDWSLRGGPDVVALADSLAIALPSKTPFDVHSLRTGNPALPEPGGRLPTALLRPTMTGIGDLVLSGRPALDNAATGSVAPRIITDSTIRTSIGGDPPEITEDVFGALDRAGRDAEIESYTRLASVAMNAGRRSMIASEKAGRRHNGLLAALAGLFHSSSGIAAAEAQSRASAEKPIQAAALSRPVLSATIDAGADVGVGQGGSRTSTTALSAGLQAEQTLFDGFRMQNSLRSARMEAMRGRASADSTIRAIAVNAIGAYADLLYADNLVALQKSNRDFATSQLGVVQARFDLGEGTLGELSYARAQALSATADLETAKGTYDDARAKYERIFETAPGKISPIPATNRCLPSSMEAAVALGLQKAPEIAEARADANKAMYDFRVAEGSRLPTIKLTASVNSDSSLGRTVSNGLPGVNLSRTSDLTASAGVKLTVPLYDGGNTKSVIREARETYYQKKYNSEYVAREIEKNIRSAYIAMDVARENLDTMTGQYQSISKFFYATIREYEIGEKNLDDIYDAQFQKVAVEDRILLSERDFLTQAYIVQMFSGCI